MYRFIIFFLFSTLIACSDNGEDAVVEEVTSQERVFQTQLDALEKAKETEQMMLDVMEQQRQTIKAMDGNTQ
jgi:hypothetical protein